ncbi:MAG TPA: aminomethyl-transferring glycine dehydrogenase subunit GcvPB [Spirochaetota bacterium]|nr:aminomethyl-transferring glycine dehydrogenase subunit GcvPB [Spirochaetota bacterium]HOR93347.1 aminomethyl-transferring glycine dehydrogenase subunit GcvPB [Spirochaetota bacterium]HRR61221.1 aminomethyl-transferring glycine dehydrogenase subunit GcvPB [Spirochaetota bacterium]
MRVTMQTIFSFHKKGKNKYSIPACDPIQVDEIPESMLRDDLTLVDVSEVDVVRHYRKLSSLNFGVDNGMYPLGSCTMKYNPKINDVVAMLPQFAMQHPATIEETGQGALHMMYQLQQILCQITGMHYFSLSPAAGAHGELTSVMIIKKYFETKGEKRNILLIPDSAHGTNPASVAMCGFEVKEIPSDSDGDVDLTKLEDALNEHVAAMMLTSPNTLGLFDRNILKIAEMLHSKGALFYCDGANLNAVVGKVRPVDMGFDIMHVNLHKTFSTPHGGGGPGAGPIGVVGKLAPFLPVPIIEKADRYYLQYNRPLSIGRIHSFFGNFMVMLRAYTYIMMLGSDGLRSVAEHAVCNANYLRTKLRNHFQVPYNRICMHEFVINDEGLPNGITTNEVAKRLLDYGFHAPTVYFPLIVHGAMMIEPTETEHRDTLDAFADAMLTIKKEAAEDPALLKKAPVTTPVRKVDAVLAARKPVLKWDD